MSHSFASAQGLWFGVRVFFGVMFSVGLGVLGGRASVLGRLQAQKGRRLNTGQAVHKCRGVCVCVYTLILS